MNTVRAQVAVSIASMVLSAVLTAHAAEAPKITHDWPGYTGPEGTFADPSKAPLLDDLSRAKLVWVSEHDDMGWGKTYSAGGSGCYPRTMFPSGYASLIVASGLVIAGYFHPKDNVVADDIILAVDAATGKTRWKQVYAGKGINRGGGKHPTYGPAPVAGDGKVFHLGSSGRLYCVELATGKPLWDAEVGDLTGKMDAIRTATPVRPDSGVIDTEPETPTTVTPLMFVDGVVMVNALSFLFGLDAATGKTLWRIAGATSTQSVPCPAKLNGIVYALCSGADGYMRLIRLKTGEVVWKEFLGACFLPIVADGRAFVPRLKDPGKPRTKEEQPVLTAFALSESGAKMLWQSAFPMEGDCWHAYRDGVIYANAPVYQPAGGKIMAFKADDGSLLGMYDDRDGDRGRFHLWGDRLVVVGDNHHESINSACYYWALTPGVKDLKKSGKGFVPRRWGDYKGVCGYEVLMRDAFADGFQFTRAIDAKKAKGVIMCWDLRARPKSALLKFRLDGPMQGLPKAINFASAEAELEDGKITGLFMDMPMRTANAETVAHVSARGVPKEETGPVAGRWKGDVAVRVGEDPETWRFDLQIDGATSSGTYERAIPALAKTAVIDGNADAKLEVRSDKTRRWVINLVQAVSREPDQPAASRTDMYIVVDRTFAGEVRSWARARRLSISTHEVQLTSFESGEKTLVCKGTVLFHADTYVNPSAERAGTVAMAADITLHQDGEAWKGTYRATHGVAWTCQGTTGGQ